MKLLMIRHGEPRYDNVRDLGLVSYLGELTPAGVEQAEAVADDERLQDADIIISSPFTRALQTASIISRKTGIPLTVEPAFHEILLDTKHELTTSEIYTRNSYKEFAAQNGIRDDETLYDWESLEQIVNRAYPAMKKYLHYNKVIVVAHATLIRTFGYKEQGFPYCGIFECEFDESSECKGFVTWNPENKIKEM